MYRRSDEHSNTFTNLPERKLMVWLMYMQSDSVKLILHHRQNLNSHDEPDKLGGLTICHHVIKLMSEKKKQQKFAQKHFLGWWNWLDVHRHDVIPQLLGVFELTVNVIQQYDS